MASETRRAQHHQRSAPTAFDPPTLHVVGAPGVAFLTAIAETQIVTSVGRARYLALRATGRGNGASNSGPSPLRVIRILAGPAPTRLFLPTTLTHAPSSQDRRKLGLPRIGLRPPKGDAQGWTSSREQTRVCFRER